MNKYHFIKESRFLKVLFGVLISMFIQTSIHAQENLSSDELINKHSDSLTQLSVKEYLRLSHIYYNQDSLLLSNKCIKEGIELARQENDMISEGNFILQKGYIHLSWGGYDKALHYFTEAYDIGSDYRDTVLMIGGFHGKGRVYSEIDDNVHAIVELNLGLDLAKDFSKKRTIAIFNNALGIASQGLKEYQQAIKHFEINQEISAEIGDSLTEIYAIINKGSVYLQLDDTAKAKQCFELAEQKNQHQKSSYAQAAILGNFGNLFLITHEIQKSIYYSIKSIELSKANRFAGYLVESYNTLYKSYNEINDFQNALFYYKKHKELEDSLMNSDKIADINRLRIQHQVENEEARNEIIQAKLRNRTIISFSTILFAIFLITIFILLYSRYRLNKKVYKKEKEELNLTIDEQNRRLVSQLMETKIKHRILDEAGSLLDAIEKTKDQEELKRKVEEFKNTVQKSNKVEDDWQKINFHFEKVHQDFFKKLLESHPQLSTNDLKLCAYTKMNLSTKDIANLMNISYRSVQTNRYRIKKKMKLDNKVNFTSYIQTV